MYAVEQFFIRRFFFHGPPDQRITFCQFFVVESRLNAAIYYIFGKIDASFQTYMKWNH